MQYRREIDGLRSIAVLPVLLFHAGFSLFSGGYVGVDIFFVISGYLITSIIAADISEKRFSLVDFYERRARRILPALFLVMAACIPFAWYWLLPGDMKDFSQSLVAVISFSSNILFWRESGYFSPAAELKPLLHTWSLAVEEQFYVLFPLFLLMIWRLGRKGVFWATAALALASLALAHWGVANKPEAAFYLLPTRGWELAIGALVALHLQNGRAAGTSRVLANALSLAGLILILYAIFRFDESKPFPGLYALVPTVGTALIILFARPETWVGGWLGARLPVAIGLISYSAYLWHQPLLAFAKHRHLHEPDAAVRGALVLASLALAYLTWRYVEAPFRNRSRITRKHVFAFSGSVAILLVIFGVAGHLSGGFPERMPPLVSKFEKPESGYIASCSEEGRTKEVCLLGDPKIRPSIAVFGDSHSRVLSAKLSTDLSEHNASAVMYEGSWCPPLIDVATNNSSKNPGCRKFITAGFRVVLADPAIRSVVLVAEWSNYTKGYRWPDQSPTFYSDAYSMELGLAENLRVVERGLQRTLQALISAGKQVVIVKSVPEYEFRVPKALARQVLMQGSPDADALAIDRDSYQARNAEIDEIFARVQTEKLATYVEPFDILCPQERCLTYIGAESLYVDANHLSKAGASLVVPHVLRAVGY